MDLEQFLAMTGAEFAGCEKKPAKIAWMACHFSPYGTGLSNRPATLPPGSMLIVNDRIPICGHDPARIAAELETMVSEMNCSCVLLDFQRPNEPETAAVVQTVLTQIPCPVGVSHLYAAELTCPVFLPPPPLLTPLAEHLAPWDGRELWLEAALDTTLITVTETGSTLIPQPYAPPEQPCHHDDDLHCTYRMTLSPNAATFRLTRTRSDLHDLLTQAAQLHVTRSVGLYQQLKEGPLP